MVNNIILKVDSLKKYFYSRYGILRKKKNLIKAVDDVSFNALRGETLGLVGESGCGKTTLGRTLIKLYKPTSGRIIFAGHDITNLKENEMLPFRKRIQMVFQDPYASLDTRMTVNDIIGEPLDIHKIAKAHLRESIIKSLIKRVGLRTELLNYYPHQLSGGQRQRIGIARALALKPDLIVFDEPTSSLDVSIQAQIINLLEDIQHELSLTYIFISHNLPLIACISDRIGVMYMGRLIELASNIALYNNPLHPYTKVLLSAIPVPDPDIPYKAPKMIANSDLPISREQQSGCCYRTRCKYVKEICHKVCPEFHEIENNHFVACHLV